jgi:chromosomal replication initiator protein
MGEFRHRFRDVDVLVIDDIHFLTSASGRQEEFFHTFNSLHQAQKQIILSSDAPPEEIPTSRPAREPVPVGAGRGGRFTPGFETRVAILMTKARLRGIELGARRRRVRRRAVETNIRELEGAITQLQLLRERGERGDHARARARGVRRAEG